MIFGNGIHGNSGQKKNCAKGLSLGRLEILDS
jgi:hypothetical protein